MMNKNKKYAIGLFATVFVLSFSVGTAITNKTVKADVTPPAFEMVSGASVRTIDPAGIRFTTVVNAEYKATLSSDYDYVWGTKLTFKPVNGESYSVDADTKVWADATQTKWYTVLLNVPNTDYLTEITAESYVKGYAKDDTEKTTVVVSDVAENAQTRSIAWAASWALNDGYTQSILNNYVSAIDTTITMSESSLFMVVNDTQTLSISETTEKGYGAVWTSSDEDVATVDKTGKVTAVGFGEATITAKIGNNSTTCAVIVDYTADDQTATTNVLINKTTGAVTDMLDGTVTEVRDSSFNSLSYDAAAGTVDASGLAVGKNVLYVLKDEQYVKVTAIVADKTISNASEFVSVMGAITTHATDYIALAGDIVFGTEEYKMANAFSGVLDGRGYAVIGLDLTKHGQSSGWNAMINGGSYTMKNIAFVNTDITTKDTVRTHLLGGSLGKISVENCYFDLKNTSRALCWKFAEDFSIKNTLVKVSNSSSAILCNAITDGKTMTSENLYVIASDNAPLYPTSITSSYFANTVKNSDGATILTSINASNTASAQLKAFANKYLGVTKVEKQNLVQKVSAAKFMETLNIDGATIQSVSCGGADLGYDATTGRFNTSALSVGEQTFTVVATNGATYEVKAIVADQIISSAAEFVSVIGAINASKDYIALSQDIIFDGTETFVMSTGTFSGVLDGRGYTVNGLDLTKHGKTGAWYAMINGGNFTMKNIAFVNMNMATVNSTRVHLCGGTSWGVTLENCYLELINDRPGLAWQHTDTFTIKNTVIVRDTNTTAKALFNAKLNNTSKIVGEEFYLVANDSAPLYDSYAENDEYFTGSVTRNSDKAQILAAINASETASAQLKAFANEYLK